MAGNSSRRGAIRKTGSKKGLEGRGAPPPAEARTKHPAARRAKMAEKSAQTRGRPGGGRVASRKNDEGPEVVLGRNPVVECLRAGVPATALWVAVGTDSDERLKESVQRAGDAGISILEARIWTSSVPTVCIRGWRFRCRLIATRTPMI